MITNDSPPPNVKLSDYIVVFEKTLTKTFCRKLSMRMKNDHRKQMGVVGRSKSLREDIKNSYDLHLSPLDDYKEEDDVLFNCLSKYKDLYLDVVQEKTGISPNFLSGFGYGYTSPSDVCSDTGYQLKMYKTGMRYRWHHDYIIDALEGTRALTYIWYLNDNFEGGETEFIDGTIIKPKTGNMLIFPASWLYVHRGVEVTKGYKVIATGWYHHQHPKTFDIMTNSNLNT